MNHKYKPFEDWKETKKRAEGEKVVTTVTLTLISLMIIAAVLTHLMHIKK